MRETMTERLVAWVRRRKVAQRLQTLDDRLLADMGIERECIETTVRFGATCNDAHH